MKNTRFIGVCHRLISSESQRSCKNPCSLGLGSCDTAAILPVSPGDKSVKKNKKQDLDARIEAFLCKKQPITRETWEKSNEEYGQGTIMNGLARVESCSI